jgi:hypothetical protein
VAAAELLPDLPLELTGCKRIIAPAGLSIGTMNAAVISAMNTATLKSHTSKEVKDSKTTHQQPPETGPSDDPCEEPLTHASVMRMIKDGTKRRSLGDALLKQKRLELTKQQQEKEAAAAASITLQQVADMIAAQIAAQAARTPVCTQVPVDTEEARLLARYKVLENAKKLTEVV